VGKGTFFNYFPTKEHVLATYGAERIAAIAQALEKVKATKGPVLPIIGELAADLAGQAHEAPALLRAIYAAHASCAPVRAQLQKRMSRARRLLAEMYAVAQERGEISRDISARELGRLTQMIFMGVTVSWSLKPEGSLNRVAAEVWELLSSRLRAGEIRTNHKRRRSVSA
jgi:AcrR family transcriptional regulator